MILRVHNNMTCDNYYYRQANTTSIGSYNIVYYIILIYMGGARSDKITIYYIGVYIYIRFINRTVVCGQTRTGI